MDTQEPAAPHTAPRNFVEHLRQLASERAAENFLTVVGERSGQAWQRVVSYGALDERVRALAASLQQHSSPGERALIMLDNDDHYVVALLACFYCGVIAVPVYPPRSTQAQHLERLAGIAADCRARSVLTTAAHAQSVRQFGALLTIEVDDIDAGLADTWQPHLPADSDIAFLQYTSGSTAAPKGVMVTHGNLMANERALQQAFGLTSEDPIVSWQPLYHDMGLIGGLLQPLYLGAPLVLTSPEYFLERPARWLELISRHRAVGSAGPDFAYRLCVERIKDSQLARLDLASWRLALTGAEPIRPDTVRDFCAKFAAAGFDATAMRACYGLAEATLVAAAGEAGCGVTTQEFSPEALAGHVAQPRAGGTELVSSGIVVPEHELRIVDPSTRTPLEAGHIGEIWLGGPSITRGYWAHPQSTADTFVTWRGSRWLRTGDLGFVRAGELFVTGRRKDLIIVRGHNVYPHDVEQAIERTVEAVRKGRVAAFAVEHRGQEGIGVAVEISRGAQKRMRPRELVDALGAAVSEAVGEALAVVALLNPGTLPRTSSGKLQRSACRKAWAARTLDAYALFEHGRFVHGDVDDTTGVALDADQQALAAIWREVLQWDASFVATPTTHFFGSGGNSLTAVQAARHVAERWDIELSASTLFEQPRLAELAQEVARLRAAGQHRSVSTLAPLSRSAGLLPLSHAQERQWFLWQLDPQSSAYHVNVALRWSGPLHLDELRAALHVVGLRHESLRTVFKAGADGLPGQFVQPQCLCDIDVIEADANDAVRVIHERSRQPFDLTRGPLLRVTLVSVDSDVHLLGVTLHHIVADAGSLQVLIGEWVQRYRSLCDGAGLPLETPRIQYADYAAWLRERLSGGEGARQLAYWRSQLAVADPAHYPVLALPTDRPRHALARYRAATYEMELPATLTQALRGCAQAHDATLFMALLAGFGALLHRYTGQEDVRIGVPVANRSQAEVAGLIGLFVNTLVFRVDVPHRLTFAQLLRAVRSTALGAQSHGELPFEQLVQALQPQRSLSRTALFQVMFNHLQEDARVLQQLAGVDVSLVPVPDGDAQFELMLDVRERSDGTLRAVFTYADELFEARTVARLAEHYRIILEGLAMHPERAVGQLDYLSADERSRVRTGLRSNEARHEFIPVHELFEAHAQRQPRATALWHEGQGISYRTLNQWANELARYLRGLGVRGEDRVAVRLERTPLLIATLLGCSKAGAAYVPLHLADPVARTMEMLRDSGARVLVTQQRISEELLGALPTDVHPLLLEEAPLKGPDEAAGLGVHSASLAYLIYTSGTTGRPKAVAVEHGALSQHVQAMRVRCGMSVQDRVLQFAPAHVDAALEQMLVPLAAGASLVLQRHWSSLAEELDALCAGYGITVLDLPPAYARQLLQDAPFFSHAPRLVLCGGEPWTWEDSALLCRVLRPRLLINAYGPTEAVITPTLLCMDAVAAPSAPVGYVPIGQPVGTRHAYVLDRELQPVAEGIPGELYLGGEHALARGYLDRAGLTAERFIADPFSSGGRLYRTGDLVRWRQDAHGVQLEYLQRIDAQLKLHGFRIEPGEIEAELRRQPGVQQAIVVSVPAASGNRLAAYVVPAADVQLDGTQLRRCLQEVLPDYLVPAVVMVLERLPLNASGKVEQRGLPVPQFAEAARPGYAAPRGEVDRTLAALWSEVLGTEQVGVHDNFFDLGGNSLLLIRAHRLLEQRLSVGLTLTDLFKFPTIEALARHIESRGETESVDSAADSQQRALLRRSALQQRGAQRARLQ